MFMEVTYWGINKQWIPEAVGKREMEADVIEMSAPLDSNSSSDQNETKETLHLLSFIKWN